MVALEQESENDFSQMEQQAEEMIRSLCREAYQTVAENRANVLSLLDQLKWSDQEIWEEVSSHPEEYLSQLALQVEVDVIFDRTGLETNQKVDG